MSNISNLYTGFLANVERTRKWVNDLGHYTTESGASVRTKPQVDLENQTLAENLDNPGLGFHIPKFSNGKTGALNTDLDGITRAQVRLTEFATLSQIQGATAANLSTIVQNAMERLANEYTNAAERGAELILPPGKFEVAELNLRPRVRICGAGWNTTTLILPAGTAADLLIVPLDAAFSGWEKLTLEGNKYLGSTGRGIVAPTTSNSAPINNPNKLGDKTINGDAAYRFISAREFAVVNFGNDGIVLGGGNYSFWLTLFNTSQNDGYGLLNGSNNNAFTAFLAEFCSKSGIKNTGSNTRFTSFEANWCGRGDPVTNQYAGFENTANRCFVSDAFAADCYGDGFILSGNDNEYHIVADSCGYKGTTFDGESSRVNAGVRIANAQRTKLNARIANYRGRLADGYQGLEYPIVVGDNVDFAEYNVSIAPNSTNAPAVGLRRSSGCSSVISSTRTSTVSYESQSFTSGVPAVVANTGLYVESTESVLVLGDPGQGAGLSFVAEWQQDSSPTSQPTIFSGSSPQFNLLTSVYGKTTAPVLKTQVYAAGALRDINFSIPLADYQDGNLYRLAINATIDPAGLLRIDGALSYRRASDSKYFTVLASPTYSLAAGSKIEAVDQFQVNPNPAQGIVGRIRALAIWFSDAGRRAELGPLPFSGVSGYPKEGLHCDFAAYQMNAPFRMKRGSLPVASAFYRGQIFALAGATGVADAAYQCVKRVDDGYSWVPLGAINKVITLSTGDFEAVSGTPALADVSGSTRRKCWAFDSASDEIISGYVAIEAGCTSLSFDLYWCNNGAGSGTVAWTVEYFEMAAGSNISAVGTGVDLSAVSAGAAGIEVITSGLIPLSGNARLLGFRIKRRTADGSLPNDAGFVAISFRPAIP